MSLGIGVSKTKYHWSVQFWKYRDSFDIGGIVFLEQAANILYPVSVSNFKPLSVTTNP